jgi:Domain of unknown function (DUF222)
MDGGFGVRPGRILTDEQRAKSALSIESLKNEITRLAGRLNAANHRFLMLIAEFDRREGWSDGGTQSCAHWLNWKCGIDMGAARESLPKISAAMKRGELSYSKVRALTRVACVGTEDYFLSIALHGTADHVENLVRGYRRARDAEELSREAQQQANRYFSYRYDDDGSLVFKGRLPAEAGALLLKALGSALEAIPPDDDRVAPDDCSSRAPTDPDVQISRIRLVDLRIRCARINTVHDAHRQQGIATQQLLKAWPQHMGTMIATVQPVTPDALG